LLAIGLFDQLAQIGVLTPGRFQIEHQVLHAQPKVIKRFLKFVDRLLNSVAAHLGFFSQLLKVATLTRGQLLDLVHELVEFILESLLVHVCSLSDFFARDRRAWRWRYVLEMEQQPRPWVCQCRWISKNRICRRDLSILSD